MENENTTKKNAWGGARAGAGRKRTGNVYCGFRATPEVQAILNAVDGNKSEFINRCIVMAGAQILGENATENG